MPEQVALLAPAKVNLALHVTGQRADGYHLLDSIAVFADVGDRVEIEAAEEFRLSVSGPFAAHAPGDAGDLAWRAATAFFEHTGLKPAAAIRVEKNIPAGAGLGGGSADAAAVLVGLDRHFATGLSADDLAAIGMKLGADVPMCLAGRALRARGIGEDIRAIEGWPPLPMVLVWPGVPVSTAAAFKSLQRRDNPPLDEPPRNADRRDARVLARRLPQRPRSARACNCAGDRRSPRRPSRDRRLSARPHVGLGLGLFRALSERGARPATPRRGSDWQTRSGGSRAALAR